MNALDLPTRTAAKTPLPDSYRWLLPRYPREGWRTHANMGAHTRFWLQLHASFRRAADDLDSLDTAFREENIEAAAFKAAMAPRLQHFLSALDHHHHMEDHVFFPRFTAAEARIAKGIDLLERDHEAIEANIHATVEAANAFLRDESDARRTGEAFTCAADALTRLMRRHLDDEEEIVMPLILDRGEAALGVE